MELWLCIPFGLLLLCVAVLPIAKPHWWEENQLKITALLSACFVLPFAFTHGPSCAAETVLECIIGDYITFIVLLFGLFCVAGNISFEGDLAGSPRVNVILLAIGIALASLIGTTGASMLMVRPVIKMNSWRKRKKQIMIFFIFLVSNMGGCLTPIGDPPLLMGFSRGVPFAWSLHLLPLLLLNAIILLTVFYHIDKRQYHKDITQGYRPDISKAGVMIKLNGTHNFIFMTVIVAAVVLSGVLPNMPSMLGPDGAVKGIHIYKEVCFTIPQILECAMILISALLSFKTTDPLIRRRNHFNWGAIKEVAILFAGIFITMQPALAILKDAGACMSGLTPFETFWTAGALSSFLDNTPTYLVFLTMAGASGTVSGIATTLGTVPTKMLLAISSGAVFMGANTYIGNAPNFMVKSISKENGINMPSFFGYIGWSLSILVPVFLVDSLLFFL